MPTGVCGAQPGCHHLIETAITHNRLAKLVQLATLGWPNGTMVAVPKHGCAMTNLATQAADGGEQLRIAIGHEPAVTHVPTTTLSDIVGGAASEVLLVKIDVEGA